MFDAIKSFFSDLSPEAEDSVERGALDTELAAAALLVQAMAADGEIRPEEEVKLQEVLTTSFELSVQEAKALAEDARAAKDNAVDLYGFTSVLKRGMNEDQRLALVEDLWEMVYADGQLHEFEDNVIWRIAELLGVQSRERMELKQRVLARQS